MKLFTACLLTETNTFSPVPTGRAAFFTDQPFHRRDGSRSEDGEGSAVLRLWRERAEAAGWEVVESITAYSEPSSAVVQSVYEELREMILDDLRAAMPVQGVLLFLHGAMVAAECDDCEGDVLARVRAIVGPDVVVGVELDLHCHLTDTICDSADAVVIFKEYPHTDTVARAGDLYAIVAAALRGEVRPVTALHDCRMVGMWRTPVEPGRSIVARMVEMEGEAGILSVSFGHGFPWSDVAEVGAKTVVVADGDRARARALAARLADEIWASREASITPHDSIDAAIDAALAAPAGPVVLADVADNAGGGAPSDSTFVLRRLVERDVQGAAIGCVWDPMAVAFCFEAGEGAVFDLRIGGKSGPVSGPPIDLLVRVMALAEAHTQTGLGGGRAAYGRSAWVRAGGVDIILTSKRQQVFSPDAFTGLGCTLADKRIVVVKSMQHFYANFAPIAAAVRYIAAPGTVGAEFAGLPYTKITKPFWPRVAAPFAG